MNEPPRIDELSAAIGEIRNYIHDNRHASATLSSKFDALPILIRKENEKLEEKVTSMLREHSRDMEARLMRETGSLRSDFAKMQGTVDLLEASDLRRQGAAGLGVMLLKSPALGWIVGAASTVYLFISGRLHL